jgi:peptide deformylase
MHQQTRPVTEFGPQLHALVADMFATLFAAEGVGLAGPQVDSDLAVFVYNCPDADDRFQFGVICNPTVTLPTGAARNFDSSEEGCLSWPGAYQPLARPDVATCTGVNEDGEPVTVKGTGLLARCLQHETDHLSGIVFGDRLSGRGRRKLNEQRESLRHLYPSDWPIHPKGRDFEAAE